jgi:aspartyl/asparaginyl-tRNA synthetase
VNILEKHQSEFEVPITKGDNLKKEHELFLSNYSLQHMNQGFIFVTHWPANIKPFYMKHNESSQVKIIVVKLLLKLIKYSTGPCV